MNKRTGVTPLQQTIATILILWLLIIVVMGMTAATMWLTRYILG